MKLVYPLLLVLLLPAVRGEDIEIACEPPPGSVGAERAAKLGAKAFENEFCQGRDPTPEEAVAARRPAYYAYAKQEPKKKADPPDIIIHLPPAPPPPQPTPPAPGSPLVLPVGKLLLVTSATVELFPKWIARDGSEVSIKALKGPVVVYGDFVDPQPDDDNGRAVSDPYVYIVRAKVSGQGTLVVVPGGVKAASGIVSQAVDVGGSPPPIPVTISISPTSATVQTGGRQQFAATVSQGGVTWKCTGVGSVDQQGLFAASTSGSALIAAVSTLDPSKTATATVTVTDVPPPPTDPLTKALQAAYAAETAVDKKTKLTNLAELYGAVVTAAKASGKITTLAQLQAAVHSAADLTAGVGAMPAVRKVASEYVAGKLPKADTTLTAVLWDTATAAYGDVAKAMKGVK